MTPYTSTLDGLDSAALAHSAQADGFFIVQELVDEARCADLAARLREYASGERVAPGGVTIQREPAVVRAGVQRPDGDDIRKIDGLYHDGLFRCLIESEAVTRSLQALLGPELRLYRATALMKPPSIGSEKGVHQDAPYWPIEPMSMWSCWVPFDESTLENGCLVVVPGSHRDGPRPHHPTEDDFVVHPAEVDPQMLLAVPLQRGSGIFFHSLLLHGSAANRSPRARRAVTLSYMGAEHRYAGPSDPPPFPVVAQAAEGRT